jgi:hypothetical protein
MARPLPSRRIGSRELIRHHLLPILGEIAVIDADHDCAMVDPDTSIPFPEAEAHLSLAHRQSALVAQPYLSSGFGVAVIGAGSIYQRIA